MSVQKLGDASQLNKAQPDLRKLRQQIDETCALGLTNSADSFNAVHLALLCGTIVQRNG